MKNLLFIAAGLALASSLAAAPLASVHDDCSSAEIKLTGPPPPPTVDYTVTITESEIINLRYELQPATVASTIYFVPGHAKWNVPSCLGKPDTKRHFHWLSFVRKLC